MTLGLYEVYLPERSRMPLECPSMEISVVSDIVQDSLASINENLYEATCFNAWKNRSFLSIKLFHHCVGMGRCYGCRRHRLRSASRLPSDLHVQPCSPQHLAKEAPN